MLLRTRLAMVALLGWLGAACGAKEYPCTRAQQCVAKEGGFGMCVSGHCAFADSTCPLDFPWRYDPASGELADHCAVRPTYDAGAADAPVPDAADEADAAPDAAPDDAMITSPDAAR